MRAAAFAFMIVPCIVALVLLCAAKSGREPEGMPVAILLTWGRFVRASGPTADERAWVRKLYADWEQAQRVLLEARREAARGGAGGLDVYHAENEEAKAAWELRKAIQQVVAGVDSNAQPR